MNGKLKQSKNSKLISVFNLIDESSFPKKDKDLKKDVYAAFLVESANLGFKFSPEALTFLSTVTKKELQNLLHDLRLVVGDHQGKILFPDFPNLANHSNFELRILNLIYYVTNGIIEYKADNINLNKKETIDLNKLVLLDLNTSENDKLGNKLKSLLTQNQVFTKEQKGLLNDFIIEDKYVPILLNVIKNRQVKIKENAVFLALFYSQIDFTKFNSTINEYLSNLLLTFTDVLRFAYALNNYDIKELIENKDKVSDTNEYHSLENISLKFSRPQIHMLLSLFEDIAQKDNELTYFEMKKHARAFKLLGERLHPTTAQNRKKFNRTSLAFFFLRANQLIGHPADKTLALFNEDKNVDKLLAVLSKYPTMLLKNLHRILNIIAKNNEISKEQKVQKTNNIMTLLNNNIDNGKLSYLAMKQAYRAFFTENYFSTNSLIKVRNRFTQIVNSNDLPDYMLNIVRDKFNVILGEFLKIQYADELKQFGKDKKFNSVYVMPEARKVALPLNDRISESRFTYIPQFSRVSLKNGVNFLRSFVFWKNGVKADPMARIDLDSAMIFLDDNFDRVTTVSWNSNLKTNFALHSGDITDANPNASEFVDVDIKKAQEENIRYLLMGVNSYTGQSFNTMLNVSAGVMLSNKKIRKRFSSQNVATNFVLNANSNSVFPFIVDFKTRELIWLNLPTMNYHSADSLIHSENVNMLEVLFKQQLFNVETAVNDLFKDTDVKVLSTEDYAQLNSEELDKTFIIGNNFPRIGINFNELLSKA